jgi:hypothetical protein
MNTLEEYNFIINNKLRCIEEKNYDEGCEWRNKEVDFMMENFGIDVRSKFIKNFEKGLNTNIIGIVKKG